MLNNILFEVKMLLNKQESDKRVLLGEKADYEPLCRACYMESLKEETENK